MRLNDDLARIEAGNTKGQNQKGQKGGTNHRVAEARGSNEISESLRTRAARAVCFGRVTTGAAEVHIPLDPSLAAERYDDNFVTTLLHTRHNGTHAGGGGGGGEAQHAGSGGGHAAASSSGVGAGAGTGTAAAARDGAGAALGVSEMEWRWRRQARRALIGASSGASDGMAEGGMMVEGGVETRRCAELFGSSDPISVTLSYSPEPGRQCINVHLEVLNTTLAPIEGLQLRLGVDGPLWMPNEASQFIHVGGALRGGAAGEGSDIAGGGAGGHYAAAGGAAAASHVLGHAGEGLAAVQARKQFPGVLMPACSVAWDVRL